MFKHRNRSLIARAFLALALVFAQAGALTHSYSHRLSDLTSAPNTQLCSECLCYAPVTSPAGGSAHVLFIPQADAVPVVARALIAVPQLRPFSAFQSRAPPAPL